MASDRGDQAPADSEREQPREQQRQPHGAHPAEPVGDQAPDRLAQAVDQEVGARGLHDLAQRGVEVVGDRHQHRWHREPVERADERS